MKTISAVLILALCLGLTGLAYADTNGIAKGVDTVTHAPLAGLMTVNDHLFTPVKEVNGAVLDGTDKARGWVVSVGLNLGQPIE